MPMYWGQLDFGPDGKSSSWFGFTCPAVSSNEAMVSSIAASASRLGGEFSNARGKDKILRRCNIIVPAAAASEMRASLESLGISPGSLEDVGGEFTRTTHVAIGGQSE